MEQSKNTSANPQGNLSPSGPTKNIVDTAIAAGNFTTLVAGIKAAGLTDTLTGKGPFAMFAPTDEAFKKLPGQFPEFFSLHICEMTSRISG